MKLEMTIQIRNSSYMSFVFEKDPARIEDAIVNTERQFSRDGDGLLQLYTSEVFLLGKEIDGFVKSDIKKLRNKIR